jgi:hypothetical protein
MVMSTGTLSPQAPSAPFPAQPLPSAPSAQSPCLHFTPTGHSVFTYVANLPAGLVPVGFLDCELGMGEDTVLSLSYLCLLTPMCPSIQCVSVNGG